MVEGLFQYNVTTVHRITIKTDLICQKFPPRYVRDTYRCPYLFTSPIHFGVSHARNNIPHTRIPISGPLRGTAMRFSLDTQITIWIIYIPPDDNLFMEELGHLSNQLPSPVLLLGDFNGAHPLCGSNAPNIRGKLVVTFLETEDICLFNDHFPNFLHTSQETNSDIDLSVTSTSLLLPFQWKVFDDPCGSNHFPIVLSPYILHPHIPCRNSAMQNGLNFNLCVFLNYLILTFMIHPHTPLQTLWLTLLMLPSPNLL